jgi:hypothetical protein
MSEDFFDYDEAHPIPNLEVVDVYTVKKGGGAWLSIVIASPLQDDDRSLERLLKKIERYLDFTRAPEFVAACGVATVANTEVQVLIHPQSAPLAFKLLEKCKPWAIDCDVTLVVDPEALVRCLPN